jgi:hypothetical protein
MRLPTFLAVAALCSSALAAPFSLRRGLSAFFRRADEQKCMTTAEADRLVEVYRDTITEFDEELLTTYLSSKFVDISDSINVFIHKPLLGVTFATKEIFIEKQKYGLHFPIEILSVDARDCATIALQWVAYFGQAKLPAKGLTIMKTVWEDEMWKISHIIVEYNSIVWLLNMGGSYSWEGKTFSGASLDPGILPIEGAKPVVS